MNKMKNIVVGIMCLLLALIVYYQGFLGGFLLDDEANLFKLQLFKLNTGLDKYINFLLSSTSGSLKRPISNLTFLFHASDWPANPYYFKLVNFIFHVINGFLLFIVSTKILILTKTQEHKVNSIALLATMVWVLHPFFVSTILYPIQRMTILPTTFTLIGFIFYCEGRNLLNDNKKEASIYILMSVYLFTTLATLSKENGILLPVLLYIFEIVIFKNSGLPPLKKWHKIVLFYVPILVIIFALFLQFPSMLSKYETRNFTLYERLLSESRILILYLYHLIVPEYFTEGVYTDGYSKSIGLLKPITTLFSIITILILLVAATKYRNKFKILSFSILFYFAANILESTYIPLELYFEHRSYLPSLFLPLTLAIFLINLGYKNKWFFLLSVIVILFLSLTTYKRSQLWSDNINLHVQTALKFPESVRASTIASSLLESDGRSDQAMQILDKARKNHDNIELEVNYLNLKCQYSRLSIQDIALLDNNIKTIEFYFGDSVPFTNFIKSLLKSECIEDGGKHALKLLGSLSQNSRYDNSIIKYYTIRLLSNAYIRLGEFEKGYIQIKDFIEHAKDIPKITWSMEFVTAYLSQNEYIYAKKVLYLLEPILNEIDQDVYFHKAQAKYYLELIKNKMKEN